MRLIVISLFLALPLFALAQQPLTWQDLTGPPGFDVIRKADDNTLFSTNGRGVVYESTDAGSTWFAILAYPSSTPIDELAANGTRVAVHLTDFSITNSLDLLVWNNSPHDWTRIFAAAQPPRAYQDFRWMMIDHAGLIYLVNIWEGRLYRYNVQSGWTNIGGTQGFLGPAPNVFPFALPTLVTAIDRDDRMYVGTSRGGVYISQDTGKTWRASLQKFDVTALEVSRPERIVAGTSPSTDLRTNGGVFLSADSGKTWGALGLDEKNISAISSDAAGNLLALADGDVYKYDPNAKTWTPTNHLQNPFTTLLNVGGDFIASSEAAGLTRSFDSGDTWAGGLLRGRDVFAMAVTGNGNLLAGTLGGGVYRSAFGTGLWSALPSGTMSDYVYAFAQSGGVVYAGTDDGVYHSTDDGVSWTKANDSSLAGPAYALNALSDGTLFAATLFGILRSDDGARTWHRAGTLSAKVLFMDVSPAGEIFAATEDTGLRLSSDRGQTWTSIGLARNDIQTVRFTPSGNLMVGVYGGIYLSTNRGGSWAYDTVSRTTYTYALAFGGNQTVYAGTYRGVYGSFDGGLTWSPAGDSGLSSKVTLSLEIAPDRSLLAGTYRGGVYKSRQPILLPGVEGVPPGENLPRNISLEQNYPNPFNPSTSFRFQIAELGLVRLAVFDVLGREVATIVNDVLPPGRYIPTWNATGAASGIYYYKLQTQSSSLVRKMVLLR